MKYKCIIFDCDGVLVDSEHISSRILVEFANSLGADIDMEYAEINFTGKSLESVFNHIEEISDIKLPKNYEKEYRQKTFEAFQTEIQPVAGIHDLLNNLSVPFCVASNGPQDKMRLNLKLTQLYDKFENNIFSAYDIQKWKPDPELFIHASKKMGFNIDECVVIEDSIAGIIAAKKGGFDVYGFAKKSNYLEFEKNGAHVFFEMKNLKALLDNS